MCRKAWRFKSSPGHKKHKTCSSAGFVLFVSWSHTFSAENSARQGRAAISATAEIERLTEVHVTIV